MKKAILGMAAGLLAAGTASAAIIVANTDTNGFTGTGMTSINYDYTVQNAGSVVVVGFYTDGGNSAVSAVTGSAGLLRSDRTALAYFLNPNVGTLNISATHGSVADSGLYIWELTGVDLTAAVESVTLVGGSGNPDGTITTSADNSFIVDLCGFNPWNSGPWVSDPDANSVVTERAQPYFNTPVGGILAAGDATVGAAGTYDLGWTLEASQHGNASELAYAFAPIPEPATVGLVAAFGAGLLFVRRRFMM